MAPAIAALVHPAHQRIEPLFDLATAITQQIDSESLRYFELPLKPLEKFEGNLNMVAQACVTFKAEDYLQLVDMTGRIILRSGTQLLCIHAITGLALTVRQRGMISAALPPFLGRLNLDIDAWLIRTQSFERHYHQLFSKHAIRNQAA